MEICNCKNKLNKVNQFKSKKKIEKKKLDIRQWPKH
jgi:hypothetical protein